MKTIISTIILTIVFFFLNTEQSQAQKLERIVIEGATKSNFSKAIFKATLKKEDLHKKMDLSPVIKSLQYKNGEFTVTLTQARIKIINQSQKFRIQNNMMTGMIGTSPI